MSHPLEAYLIEHKDGCMSDDDAKSSITGLVNDQQLLVDVCAMFTQESNIDGKCYAVGKVYDVGDERYGCVTILSEDVANVIGQDFLQNTHEDINYALVSAYIEYSRFCTEAGHMTEAWDDYLNFIVQKNFLPLYSNGVRARLIHTESVEKAPLPTVAFILYQKYDEVYK
jgi:uncharacterized protein YozE (UPF0346 family)